MEAIWQLPVVLEIYQHIRAGLYTLYTLMKVNKYGTWQCNSYSSFLQVDVHLFQVIPQSHNAFHQSPNNNSFLHTGYTHLNNIKKLFCSWLRTLPCPGGQRWAVLYSCRCCCCCVGQCAGDSPAAA